MKNPAKQLATIGEKSRLAGHRIEFGRWDDSRKCWGWTRQIERDELCPAARAVRKVPASQRNSGDGGGEESRLGSDDGTVAGEFHVGENEE